MTHPSPGQFDDPYAFGYGIKRGPYRKGNLEDELALSKLSDSVSRHRWLGMMQGSHESDPAKQNEILKEHGADRLLQALYTHDFEKRTGRQVTVAEGKNIDFGGSEIGLVNKASELHKNAGGDGHIRDINAFFSPESDAEMRRGS